MKDRICVYEKFGFCRNGASCKFTHPTLVCDDEKCSIKDCSKRHPQACRFFTNYSHCKFGDSCKFLHKRKPDDTSNEEYKSLKEKYDILMKNHIEIEEKYSKLQNRVSSLEANFFDLMRNEIHKIQHDVNESNNLCNNLQSTMNENDTMDVTKVSDDNMEYTVANSYNVDDSLLHEIIDYEYDVCKYLDHEIGDIKDNLKERIIDETLKKLNSMKDAIENRMNELKHLNEQHVNLEIESDSAETYKLINDFVEMVEYVEKVPRKKFRNISDKKFDEIIEQIESVKRNKENTLHLLFNGPKSFLGNYRQKKHLANIVN